MISLIFACDEAGGIGFENGLPWPYLTEDMNRFKALTMSRPVIMGRKTFETLKRPLPDRQNVVLTRDRQWSHPGVEVSHDLQACLKDCNINDGFVIGGKEIYELALPYTHRLHITRVSGTYPADTFWDVNLDDWLLDSQSAVIKDGKTVCTFENYSCIIPKQFR